jgi:hypothetical protein
VCHGHPGRAFQPPTNGTADTAVAHAADGARPASFGTRVHTIDRMSLRRLLTSERTRTPPGKRVCEYDGAAPVRRRLEDTRAGRWHSRCFVCVVVAMALPMSIAGTVMVLDVARTVQDPLLTLATLALVWLPCVVMPLLWLATDWWHRRSLAKQTRFRPDRVDGPWMRHVWFVLPGTQFVIPLLWSLMTPEPLTQDLVDNAFVIEIGVLMLAGVLVARGVFDRVGEPVVCRRCGYPIPTDDLEHPGVCTECGRDLARPGGLALGEAIRRPVSLTLGLAIVAAGVVLRLLA